MQRWLMCKPGLALIITEKYPCLYLQFPTFSYPFLVKCSLSPSEYKETFLNSMITVNDHNTCVPVANMEASLC